MTKETWFDRGGLEAGGAVNRRVVAGGATGGDTSYTIGTVNGGGQAHNNLQPYVVSNFIIKAKQTHAILSEVINSLSSDSEDDALSAKMGKALNTQISNLKSYSTVEIKTGEKWIDNKPIYRKTFIFTGITATSASLSFSSLNTSETIMVDNSHSYVSTSSNFSIPINMYHTSTDYIRTYVHNGNKTLFIEFGSAYTMSKNIYVTLRYTKTTD